MNNIYVGLTLIELNRIIELMRRGQVNRQDAALVARLKAISEKHSRVESEELDEIPF